MYETYYHFTFTNIFSRVIMVVESIKKIIILAGYVGP